MFAVRKGSVVACTVFIITQEQGGALTPSPTRVGAPNHKVPVRGECSAALNHSGNKPPPIISMRKCHREARGGAAGGSARLHASPAVSASHPSLLSDSSVATTPLTSRRRLTKISKSNAAQFLEALGKINDDRWRFFLFFFPRSVLFLVERR